jgi:hypothetical protein
LRNGESRRPWKPAFEDEWKYTHVQDLKAWVVFFLSLFL